MNIEARYLGNSSIALNLISAAREIRDCAISEAVNLIRRTRSDAAKQIKKIKSRARRVGQQQAQARSNTLVLNRMTELTLKYQEMTKHANLECLELALAIATEIIGETVTVNTVSLSKRIAETLDTTLPDRSITISVHPDLVDQIATHLLRYQQSHTLKIRGDHLVAHGDAELETPVGKIVFSWREALGVLADHLKTAMQRDFEHGGDLAI